MIASRGGATKNGIFGPATLDRRGTVNHKLGAPGESLSGQAAKGGAPGILRCSFLGRVQGANDVGFLKRLYTFKELLAVRQYGKLPNLPSFCRQWFNLASGVL
jgi:hypothetical protein